MAEYLLLSPSPSTNAPPPPNTDPPTPPSPVLAVVGNYNTGTDADDDDSDDYRGRLAEAAGIWINPFRPLLIYKSALLTLPLHLPLPLFPPPPLSPSSSLLRIFPSSPFPPIPSSRPQLPPPLDLPLRSPRSLLRRDPDPNPDLEPDLDLFINATEASVPLDLLLPLLWGYLDLNPDLVLASQEDTPTPLL